MYIPPIPQDTKRSSAEKAVKQWHPQAKIIRHIVDSGNFTYLISLENQQMILRLTDPDFRTKSENLAELEYLLHLHQEQVQVAIPIPFSSGKLLEEVPDKTETLLASVFKYAPGEMVQQDSKYWGKSFFLTWGQTLGNIHRASRSFSPASENKRWHWKDELLLREALQLIPEDDTPSLREWDKVMEWLAQREVHQGNFGMIHADFASQNFHYHPEQGITVFDFGNCCYHWFDADLAISLSVLRRYPDKQLYKEWILEGYQNAHFFESDLEQALNWLMRLRILYVYLSRLHKFGKQPNETQQKTLRQLKERVHKTFIW